MSRRTLLVALAHPDDELGVAGTILAQRARGDRVVLLWLTRGEMTAALAGLPREEVRRRRTEQGRAAAEMLGAEARFLDFPDTGLAASPEGARRVAREVAEVRPDAVITWGDAWVRGMRHPDHQAAGRIVRDAVTLARIDRLVAPREPHRAPVPVFTLRDLHSPLPVVAVDVEPYLERILELGRHYLEGVGFGDPGWLRRRLRAAGERWGVPYAEELDAWETRGGLRASLLPAERADLPEHPDPRDTPPRDSECGGEPP